MEYGPCSAAAATTDSSSRNSVTPAIFCPKSNTQLMLGLYGVGGIAFLQPVACHIHPHRTIEYITIIIESATTYSVDICGRTTTDKCFNTLGQGSGPNVGTADRITQLGFPRQSDSTICRVLFAEQDAVATVHDRTYTKSKSLQKFCSVFWQREGNHQRTIVVGTISGQRWSAKISK